MDKIKMTAHAGQYYNTRAIRAGQDFDVDSEEDANDLEAIKFASRKKVDSEVSDTSEVKAVDIVDSEASDDSEVKITQTNPTVDNGHDKYNKNKYDHRNQKARR